MARRRVKRKVITAAKRRQIDSVLSLANNVFMTTPCTSKKRWLTAAQKKAKSIGNSALAKHAKKTLKHAKQSYNRGCDTITGRLR